MAHSEDRVLQISTLFEQCRLQHRKAYPSTSVDFDRLDLTGRLTHGKWAYAKGNFSDVYKGETNDGIVVAIKTLRLPAYSDYNDKVYRATVLRFFREFNSWSQLTHINVVMMLGYSLSDGTLCLVSPWHSNGNLVQYLQVMSDASKPDLALDVAEGIQYLHTRSPPLVHGDLKGANILISEHGIACLADFGLSQQIDDLNRQTGFTTTSGVTGTLPFIAPELNEGARFQLPCDIYSCAGVFLQIYCPGKVPYHYISNRFQVAQAKSRGEIPQRSSYPEMDEKEHLWQLMESCWARDPGERPDISATVRELHLQFQLGARLSHSDPLRPILNPLSAAFSYRLGDSLFKTDNGTCGHPSFDNAAVQRVAELFQTYRASYHESYPQSSLNFDRLDLTEKITHGNWTHARGHFADVYKGKMNDGTIVAVKTLRLPMYNLQDDKIYYTAFLRFFREINIWSELKHPNVAPYLGYTLTHGNLSLVSLWYDKGDLVQFLRTGQDISGPDLILDVAEGIQYLHTRSDPLVHGDLKGTNILVNEHGIASLADFGISKQIDDMNRITGFTTTSRVTGTMPWMAPELMNDLPLTLPYDVYSCAGVFLEICCPGKTPYLYRRQEWDPVLAKDAGTLPDLAQYPEMMGKMALWEIMCTCWAQDPLGRPTINSLVKSLYNIFKLSSRTNQTVTLRPGENPNTGQNGASPLKRLRLDSMESGSGQHAPANVKTRAKRQKQQKPDSEPASSSGTPSAQADGPSAELTIGQLMAMKVKDIPAEHMKRGKGWCATLGAIGRLPTQKTERKH